MLKRKREDFEVIFLEAEKVYMEDDGKISHEDMVEYHEALEKERPLLWFEAMNYTYHRCEARRRVKHEKANPKVVQMKRR